MNYYLFNISYSLQSSMILRKFVKKMLKKTSSWSKTKKRRPKKETRSESVFLIWETQIPLLVIKSPKRKRNMAMKIDTQGISMRIPLRTTKKDVRDFLSLKKNRIAKKRCMMTDRKKAMQDFAEWTQVPYLGKKYPLIVTESDARRTHLIFCENSFSCDVPEWLDSFVKKERINWALKRRYIQEANKLIIEETLKLAQQRWLNVKWIFIKSYRAKYGQCAWNDVFFSYKIIQFPIEIIRHIILHELAHIKHRHHKKSFRDFLTKMDPKTKENVKWLKDHGIMLE